MYIRNIKMANIIEITNLTRKYGNFTAVNNISFNIKEGDIFGFLGHNGAGKTTIINMLTSLLEPTNGHATISVFDKIKEIFLK